MEAFFHVVHELVLFFDVVDCTLVSIAPIVDTFDINRGAYFTVLCLQQLNHDLLHLLKRSLRLDCDLLETLNVLEERHHLD